MLEPDLIDPLAFAAEKRELRGSLSPAEMDERVRSHEYLAGNASPLRIVLRGGKDKWQRPFLDLHVGGDMQLMCQCCMKPLAFELDENARIVLFADEGRLDEAMLSDNELEGMVAEREISVRTLVEDQILMAMPYAPRHENCGVPTGAADSGRPNPFAVLAWLKSSK